MNRNDQTLNTGSTKFKLLIVDGEREWRGGQNQALLLALGLRAKGYDIGFACPRGSVLSRRVKSQGFQFHPLLRPGILAWLLNPLWLSVIGRYRKYDLADAQSSRAHSWVALARWLGGIPFVVHRRMGRAPRVNAWNRWKYGQAPRMIIAISHWVAHSLKSLGVPQAKLEVIPSGFIPSQPPINAQARQGARRDLERALGLTPGVTLIAQVGAFTREKGHEDLLQALAILKRQGLLFHAVLAGSGPLQDEIELKRLRLDLEHEVSLLGEIKQVSDVLAAADIFAFPSLEEALGSSLLQAADAGAAIVATKVGGIPEVIEHGVSGLLVPAKDPEALARALEQCDRQPRLRERLSLSARMDLTARFAMASVVEHHHVVFTRLMGSKLPS